MIYFKKIKWCNLLSTGNQFTEFDLCSKDTTLVIGANGAGKSTILDALSFGLFGKPFRKINKPQLVNSITQKGLVVEVEFSIGSVEYKVVRGIKPTIFEVYQNGSLLNQSADIADYQDILEKQIIKVNHKSFCQVVVLGTATFQPFMQLPAAQRRDIIEDLLGLQIFTVMNSLLKDKLLINKDEMNNIITEKKVIESKIEMTKQHLVELQNNNEKMIDEKKKLIEDAQEQIKELNIYLKKISKQIKELESNIVEKDNISNKINKLSKLRHQIEAKSNILNENIKFFETNDSCPTCKQEIDKDFKHAQITEKNCEIDKINDGLKKLSDEYDVLNNNLKEIMKTNSEIQDLEMEKIRVKTNVQSSEKYIKKLEQDIEKIKKIHNVNSENKINDFEKQSKEIEDRYNKLSEDKTVLSFASTLLKDDGIKSKIIKQYIPIINKLINKYLAEFELFCEFELDENFSETIKSRFRDSFTYSSFSEGEKQKIDLALLFTWRAIAKLRNSINTNLLIFDEILDSSLDNNSVSYLMNVVNDVSKDNNIIIISHKEQMTEKFTHVVHFKKIKNFSTIE